MIFNSYTFAIFFLVIFTLFYLPLKKGRLLWQNIVILAGSYVFYGWWDWRFLLLIAFTSLSSYLSGILMARGRHRRLISGANVAVNIAILAFFKYFNFFIDSFVRLFSLFGAEVDSPTLNIILPVGISFYTFQALSYSIDVYRGKVEVCRDPLKFFAFVSFFPALVAGPIERASNLLPQFDKAKPALDYRRGVEASFRILYGLLLKVVVADRLAVFVDGAWKDPGAISGISAFVAVIFFAFQLYLDFAAYSGIAKGVAALLGFDVMTNFRRPYLSKTFKEFWKRWHISLSSWFMDYVYIPLGGNRRGETRRMANLMTVFVLSGLWHGASWTFIVWGAVNGAYLIVLDRWLKNMKKGSELVVFMCWALSLVLFRAPDFHSAGAFLSCFTGSWDPATLYSLGMDKVELFFSIGLVAMVMALDIAIEKCGARLRDSIVGSPFAVRLAISLTAILFIALLGHYGVGNDSSFIYFQF